MPALLIPSNTTFGSMTNQTVGRLLSLNTQMERLKDAIATAASGYEGVEGTEYEAASMGMNMMAQSNNFGVVPDADPAAAGKNGKAYAYAVNVLTEHWATFWAAAEAAIGQLDNGGASM
jgi:hypothetical protein